MEITLNEIGSNTRKKLNPEYVKTLDKIEKEDKRIHFRNIEEFDKHFGLKGTMPYEFELTETLSFRITKRRR
jgi:hypothetical protein